MTDVSDEIVLVPIDAKVMRAPIDCVMAVTSTQLRQALERVDAIASETGANPEKLAKLMLADELRKAAPPSDYGVLADALAQPPRAIPALVEAFERAVDPDDEEIHDGRTVSRVGADGVKRTEVLRTFDHPDDPELQCACGRGFPTVSLRNQHEAKCAELKNMRIPKRIESAEFRQGDAL